MLRDAAGPCCIRPGASSRERACKTHAASPCRSNKSRAREPDREEHILQVSYNIRTQPTIPGSRRVSKATRACSASRRPRANQDIPPAAGRRRPAPGACSIRRSSPIDLASRPATGRRAESRDPAGPAAGRRGGGAAAIGRGAVFAHAEPGDQRRRPLGRLAAIERQYSFGAARSVFVGAGAYAIAGRNGEYSWRDVEPQRFGYDLQLSLQPAGSRSQRI